MVIFFIFLMNLPPSYQSSMFYFYNDVLKFTPTFLGFLRTINSVAMMLGIIVYQVWLKNVNMKKTLFYSSLVICFCGFAQLILITRYNVLLGIPDKLFLITDGLVVTTIGELTSIPLLVYASRICPKNMEGTMYALITSTCNLGGSLSAIIGGSL